MAQNKKIPGITCAPLGMGSSIIVFNQSSMSFVDYFQIKPHMNKVERLAHFVAGINPSPWFIRYLFKEYISFSNGSAPSLNIGILTATTVMTSEVMKMILKRGDIRLAPHITQVDFFFYKLKKSWIPFGNKNIRQKILIYFLKKEMNKEKPLSSNK